MASDCPGAASSTGAIDITPIGGNAPYTFLWSNGATTEDITGIAAGTYTVIISDQCGLTSPFTFTVASDGFDCGTSGGASDVDNDGVPDSADNCPNDPNPSQINADGDEFGAACDCNDNDPNAYPGNLEICDFIDNNCDGLIDEGFDPDNDGIVSCEDNCPNDYNPNQLNQDDDDFGFVCDCNDLDPTDGTRLVEDGDQLTDLDANQALICTIELEASEFTAGDPIEWSAGFDITMEPGFVVEAGPGVDFTAMIEACSNISPLEKEETNEVLPVDLDEKVTEVEEEKTYMNSLEVYPNPFEGKTNVLFEINKTTMVNVDVYDMTGHKVAVLINNSFKEVGTYKVEFKAGHLAKGIYIVLLTTEDEVIQKRIILME